MGEGGMTAPGTGQDQVFPVLLINPSSGVRNVSREDRLRTYLSLGTLASALQDRAFVQRWASLSGRFPSLGFPDSQNSPFQVQVLSLDLKPPRQTIVDYLRSFLGGKGSRPRLVGMTATSAHLDEAAEIAAAVKVLVPQALRVIGGPHVSVVPSSFLAQTEYQVACIGEGVETFTDLVLTIMIHGSNALSRVGGIAYKDGSGAIQITPPRDFLCNLDDHPFPSESLCLFVDDLEDFARNARDLVYVFSGSGCPYRCIFCGQGAIHRGLVRQRSAENIFSEIERLHARGFRKFALVQETFFFNPGRIDRFCSLIESSLISFEWTAEARADQLTFPLLERLKKAGLRFLQIGVETGDQALLDSLGKGIDLQRVKELRTWCETLQIDTAYYMLVGLPGQDWQSILRSALFLQDHLPYNRITRHVSVAVAVPYPGTQIHEKGTVRIIDRDPGTLNWPDRNIEILAGEEGEFGGRNFTKTDAMSSEEIMEAYTCLDDFGHFLLHARYDPTATEEQRLRSLDFAQRLFYMVERRTIRDLILRAQEELTPEKYQDARKEILHQDGGREAHFKDITPQTERQARPFTDFLAGMKFRNGFQIMKRFTIPNRVRWLKICSLLWEAGNRSFSALRFEQDLEAIGDEFNRRLERISSAELTRLLEAAERGIPLEEISLEFQARRREFRFYGFRFELNEDNSILQIRGD